MTQVSRRNLLAGTGAAFALLAGCSGSETRSSEAPPSAERPIEYDFEKVRSTSDPTVFRTGERTKTGEPESQRRTGREYLATEADVESVEFASTEAGEKLHSFVADTDFETESVFLYASGVSACHAVRLQAATVDAEDGDPHLDFCRSVRSADVACSDGEVHTVAYAVRLHRDGREASGHGMSMSHQCRDQPDPSIYDATVTPPTEGPE